LDEIVTPVGRPYGLPEHRRKNPGGRDTRKDGEPGESDESLPPRPAEAREKEDDRRDAGQAAGSRSDLEKRQGKGRRLDRRA